MKTQELTDALTVAFIRARHAALLADPGEGKDGGTCNMDTPVIHLRGLRKEVAERAAQAAGIRVSEVRWLGSGFFVFVPLNGQADRRSAMAVAATRALRAADVPGMEATTYYQMD